MNIHSHILTAEQIGLYCGNHPYLYLLVLLNIVFFFHFTRPFSAAQLHIIVIRIMKNEKVEINPCFILIQGMSSKKALTMYMLYEKRGTKS